MPCVAYIFIKALIVLSEVLEFIGTASYHFLYASTTIKKVCPKNGPAFNQCATFATMYLDIPKDVTLLA